MISPAPRGEGSRLPPRTSKSCSDAPWSSAGRLRSGPGECRLGDGEDGFTLIEVLAATLVLVTGLLGLFGMLDLGSQTTARNRLRQAGTSLAREIVEDVRGLSYSQIVASSLAATLQPLVAGSTVSSSNLTVSRSIYTFSVSLTACSLDDPSDGYGSHAGVPSSGGGWCPDVAASGSADTNPDDYKRVSVTVTPTGIHTTPRIQQTVLVYGRDVNGLAVTCLSTSTTCPGTNQTYTSGTSQAFNITTNAQAAAIQWLVNGSPPPSTQIPVGSNDPYAPPATTSSFTWNFPAADGTYTISGRGFDANGNSGTTSSLQVVLNRHQATPPAAVNAGWDELINGVDVQWVPSVDKDILYYTVYHQYGNNAPSVVAGCAQVTGTSCTDLSAPSPHPPPTPLLCTNPPQSYTTADLYWVVGVDTDPTTGQPRVSTLTSPKVDANICNHRPNAPIGLVGVPLNGAMTLTWVAAPIADPDAGDSLLGWRVYRWPTGQAPNFPGSRLALVGTLDSSGHPLLTYTDSTADPLGITQTYCVTSVDTHMDESPCSLVVSG